MFFTFRVLLLDVRSSSQLSSDNVDRPGAMRTHISVPLSSPLGSREEQRCGMEGGGWMSPENNTPLCRVTPASQHPLVHTPMAVNILPLGVCVPVFV